MSESTITLSVSRQASNIIRSVTTSPVDAWNGAAGNYADAAKRWAGAYVAAGEAEENIALGRTALAALMVKALDETAPRTKSGKAGKATAEKIAETLGMAGSDLNSALPGQWRIAARLYTDLAMDPTAPVTRWLVSTKPAGWGKAAEEATSEEDMVRWVDSVCKAPRVRARLGLAPLPEPARAITPTPDQGEGEGEGEDDTTGEPSGEETSAPDTDTTSGRGAGDPDHTVADLSKVRSNRDAILTAEQALARIDWAALTDADREGLVRILGAIDAGLSA